MTFIGMGPTPVEQTVSTIGAGAIAPTDWLSFAQSLIPSLVWPVFWAILLALNWRLVRLVIISLARRIRRGAPVQVGLTGISVGEEPKLTAVPATHVLQMLVTAAAEADLPPHLADVAYLVHFVGPLQIDPEGRETREAAVWVDADDSRILDSVERVVYHLHPTLQPATQTINTRETGFRLYIPNLRGEFNIRAELYFRDHQKPLELRRYINFYRSRVIERLLLRRYGQ